MKNLQILTVVEITALIAVLAIYLFIVGMQLKKVAGNLEDAADLVWKIKQNAECIEPGLKRINHTGAAVAGALPLLYGMAEGIVVGATYKSDPNSHPAPARPAMGVRRSRQLDAVGFIGN